MTNPYEPPVSSEWAEPKNDRIQSLSNKSLIFGLLGIFCCGLIFGPMAINYGNQAEAAIILDDSGARHGSRYKVGRGLGYAALILWALSFLFRIVKLASR